jgi:hypothetical protein
LETPVTEETSTTVRNEATAESLVIEESREETTAVKINQQQHKRQLEQYGMPTTARVQNWWTHQ